MPHKGNEGDVIEANVEGKKPLSEWLRAYSSPSG